ncbi:hypothetical protein AB0N23_21515 [Streptomyces sp. NPDC052644]
MNYMYRAVGAVVAAATTGSLLLAGAPAALADSGDAAEALRAAAVIERATGTADLSSGSTAISGAAKVSVPAESSGRIEGTTVDGGRFSLGLPETKSVRGVRSDNGTVVYANAGEATDLAVQLTQDGSARALVKLKNQSAPSEHRFELDLPEGVSLQSDGRGGYLAVKQDTETVTVVGQVEAPWAKDALGNPVATQYELEGETLVQTVQVNADTAFPVVADPKISFGTGIYIKYSKAEVKKLYSKVTYLNASASVCSIGGLAGIPCAAITLATANKVKNTWEYAKDNGRCIEVKIAYNGMFSGIKHYSC